MCFADASAISRAQLLRRLLCRGVPRRQERRLHREREIATGSTTAVDFDMTRKEYLDKMSPEERKALEDYKKSAGDAMTKTADSEFEQSAAAGRARTRRPATMRRRLRDEEATTTKPERRSVWIALAGCELAPPRRMRKTARRGQAGQRSDDRGEYTDAATSYKRRLI